MKRHLLVPTLLAALAVQLFLDTAWAGDNDCIWGEWYTTKCPVVTLTASDPGQVAIGDDVQINLTLTTTPGERKRDDNCGRSETNSFSGAVTITCEGYITHPDGTVEPISGTLPGSSFSRPNLEGDLTLTFTATMALDSGYGCGSPSASASVFVPAVCASGDGGGGGCCGSDLGSGSDFGNSIVTLKSVSVRLNLGAGTGGLHQAGRLYIHQQPPSAALATPQLLQFGGFTNDAQVAEVIRDGAGALRQVKVAEGLADIVTLNSRQYEVRFHTNAGTQSGGLYQPVGSAALTYTVENPDANAFNRLWLTRAAGGGTRTWKYTWTEASLQWKLESGTGSEARVETLASTAPSNGTRTETREVRDSNDQLVRKVVTTYGTYAGVERVTSEVVDPDGAALTTSYQYLSDGRLEQVIHPDGSWSYREYDTSKRLAKVYSTHLNQGPTTTESACRVVAFDYAPHSGSGDNGPAWVPRTIVEKLLGSEVRRTYAVLVGGERREIQCQTVNAAWNASDNLITVIRTNTSGSFVGEVAYIERPDGVVTLYTYASGSGGTARIVTVAQGQPNTGKTAIVAGTTTVTHYGAGGEVRYRSVTDIASNKKTEEATFSEFDARRRPGRADYLDGTAHTWTYACCGVESETDRQGVTTSYGYDSLGRRTTVSRDGLSVISTLDPLGRARIVTRDAGNNNTAVIRRASYDGAGRLTASFDLKTGTTTYAEAVDGNGQTVRTTTYTNAATRVETRAKDGRLLEVGGNAAHPVRYEYGVESEGGVDRPYARTIQLNGTDTSEWVKTYDDLLGRGYKTVYPDAAYRQVWYNSKGQAWKERDPDNVITLRLYNPLGEGEYTLTALSTTARALTDYGTLESSLGTLKGGTDRITQTVRDVVSKAGVNLDVRRVRTFVWHTNTLDEAVETSAQETALTALRAWSTSAGLTSETRQQVLGGGAVLRTNFAPDQTFVASRTLNDRLLATTNYSSAAAILGWTTNGYDAHRRLETVTDARNGTTTYTYNSADLVETVTTPPPQSGQSGLVTTTTYSDLGQILRVTQPDNTTVTNEYHLTGELKMTCGSRAYPVEYTYDHAGRMKTMKTWQNFAGDTGAAITEWNYDAARGWLTGKRFDAEHSNPQGPDYTYTAGGRLATRQWARLVSGTTRLTTTYTYNDAGELATDTYNDNSTPGVTHTYNRRGQPATVTRDNVTTTRHYTTLGLPTAEGWSGGPLDGWAVTNLYDSDLRRATLQVRQGGTLRIQQDYAYNTAGRLDRVWQGSYAAYYAYEPLSPLVDTVEYRYLTSTVRLTGDRAYDHLNRLTDMVNTPQTGSVVSHGYTYNAASQRTNATLADGSFWKYDYDPLGQVTNGWQYTAGGQPVSGRQYAYAFDDIGNRDQTVINSTTTDYTANLLNQYTTVGAASPTHDADGNLTADGTWTYTWDGENRLTALEKSNQRLEFTYDWQGRRVQKKVFSGSTGNWSLTLERRFVYDGWNLLAIMDGNAALKQQFMWGTDLSGTPQGAGGVGGLVKVYDHSLNKHFFPGYDGNGNIMLLVDGDTGAAAARYEYGPFGELLSATGSYATANPCRFSTKFTDDETGLLYYGYRYYTPSWGRWASKDPINESGFQIVAGRGAGNGIVEPDLYAFVANDPIQDCDLLGLKVWPPPPNEVNPPPTGPFKKCRIGLNCHMTYFPYTCGLVPTLQKHCGLVIDTGDAVYRLNGSGGDENRRNLTPGSIGDVNTGQFTDNPSSVCECLLANIKPWNDRHVPRDQTCANSNWNLKCMNDKCKVKLDWGSQDKPMGYNCKECVGTEIKVGTYGYCSTCCGIYKEKPCPDR